ncbi:nuclear transport factor 2 family protein [Burkholderia pyrrocinia]|uniref:nuclear transport factor 2 family protein n=1 Tax=Burkholderia pyrrocinia TaxID=60550 RepID=UPI001F15CF22|nr:nuclear transport factor 2 family protein [Burkholderia pyrrocinia]
MIFRESMMNVTLPSPLDVYLNAEANNDTAPLVHCFASDAVVHDEGRTIKGLEAIQAWKKDSKARYQYRVEPLDLSQNGAVVTMRARLTGSFPGSPLELTYTFVLADGKIASLEIR